MLEVLAEMMVPVYVSLIRAGKKTVDQVPPSIRARVIECLDAKEELS